MIDSVDDNKVKDRHALELAPGVRQETILSPQLRASLRVLQMDLPTLVEEVRHEAEVNPVVEVERPDDMPTVSEELRADNVSDGETGSESTDDGAIASVSADEEAAERRQRFFDRQVASESLQEHLLAQITSAGFSGADRQLAEMIIGDIDEEGRYVGSLDDLAAVIGSQVDEVEQVLKRIQSFDPPGVGGRDLQECLMIQARQLELEAHLKSVVVQVLDGHLKTLARRGVDGVAEELGVGQEVCSAAVKIIRELEPKPGRPFVANGKQPQMIRPEINVELRGRQMLLTSCEHELPTIVINPTYVEMASNPDTPKDTQRYLRERIGSAELLQDAIRRRGETVLKVAEEIFAEQYEFLSHGFEALRPLTIEEIARRTGFHGTTVGRAVRGKYVRTPRGVYELKSFFCAGKVAGSKENSVSAVAVKCRLAGLIKSESDDAVLTDDELAKLIATKSGISISRRTVAKYRSALGIPTAFERKKRRQLS